MDTETPQDRYRRWWMGRLIVRNGYMEYENPKRCIRVQWIGPPSGFYGTVVLHFDDGTSDHVRPTNLDAFRPRKSDVGVHPEP